MHSRRARCKKQYCQLHDNAYTYTYTQQTQIHTHIYDTMYACMTAQYTYIYTFGVLSSDIGLIYHPMYATDGYGLYSIGRLIAVFCLLPMPCECSSCSCLICIRHEKCVVYGVICCMYCVLCGMPQIHNILRCM
jgi:hypothetical protein